MGMIGGGGSNAQLQQLLQQMQGDGIMGPQQVPSGSLSQLPASHQAAAAAPPPPPGGGDFSQLGPYAQQALGLAGIQPPGGPQGGVQPGMPGGQPPGMPGGQPPGGQQGTGQGMPPGMGMPGKGSVFGGNTGLPPGLLDRLR